jgi:hypothetical protein
MAETITEYQERMSRKAVAARWPDDVPVPTSTPKLRLTGQDGNVFSILGRANKKARAAKWTDAQWEAFRKLACCADYDHALQTCMKYFDVS